MFGIAWSEFLIIGIIAIVVVPPKDLPAMMRTVGRWIGQMRRMTSDFQSQVQSALREAEFEDLRKSLDVSTMDVMADIREEMESAAKPLTDMDNQIRDDLSIEPSRGKSFPLDMNAPTPVASSTPILEPDNTAAPTHVAWPGAMEAGEGNQSISESAPDHGVSEPAPNVIERPRLPAHLRGPDPEPVSESVATSEEHDAPVARVSGASS